MLGKAFQLVFCPCLADAKLEDVRGYPTAPSTVPVQRRHPLVGERGHGPAPAPQVAVLVRSDHARTRVRPGLSNLTTAEATLQDIYAGGPLRERSGTPPQAVSTVPEANSRCRPSAPRCEPWIRWLRWTSTSPGVRRRRPVSGRHWSCSWSSSWAPRAAGPRAVLGAGSARSARSVPHEASGRVARFHRRHEVTPDATTCLLDQGLICMASRPARVAARFARVVNMVCEGATAPRKVCGSRRTDGCGHRGDDRRRRAAGNRSPPAGDGGCGDDSIVDPAGTFYRFSLAHSLLRRARVRATGGGAGEPA